MDILWPSESEDIIECLLASMLVVHTNTNTQTRKPHAASRDQIKR